MHDPHDPNSSDHVVAVTQLKEKIANLQKQISIKESQLLAKDRQVSRFSGNFLINDKTDIYMIDILITDH